MLWITKYSEPRQALPLAHHSEGDGRSRHKGVGVGAMLLNIRKDAQPGMERDEMRLGLSTQLFSQS